MSISLSRAVVVSSLAAGALWLLTGAVRFGLMWTTTPLSRLAAFLPATAPGWGWPAGWAILSIALGTASVVVLYALFAELARGRRAHVGFAAAWFAAVAAGAVVGFAVDLMLALGSLPLAGLLAFSSSFADNAADGAFWGLLAGWIPALVASRGQNKSTDAVAPRTPLWLALVAIATVVVFVAAGTFGYRAARTASAQESAISDGATTERGALPDPYAEGEPVPTVAPDAGPLDPTWCTPDQATLLLGGFDAATGHRIQSIQLMNFSEEPCIVEGYVDIAFGDQNDHLLAVVVEPGSSFMAADPGPQRIEVPAGGYAIAHLGWDAASTHGALVATSLHAAQNAGMTRGSWPVELDIVEGSTVEVTAWQLDESGGVRG